MDAVTSIFRVVKRNSPILYWIVILHFLGALGATFGLFLDERTLMGVNVWVKPLKFFLSVGIYILTVGYLIVFYPYSNIKKHIIRNLVSFTLLGEMAIIAFQAARGVQSHYNISTEFDAALFKGMGILIGVNVLIMLLFIIDTIRLKLHTSKAMQYAILIGWIIVVFGSWAGGQMIAQMSHNVGVVDGGEGLPLLNWSTVAGDLRVAHFFGLHAIQIIPLFVVGLNRTKILGVRSHLTTVWFFGLCYAGWLGFIFYQAKMAMPFIG
ncbi:MAG: hypothetical protein AAGH81_10350 [Bacteroidota bacterium]